MKDKNRIKSFLKQFEELWEQYPNLSFGQLVYDLSKKNDIYNIKDDEYLDTINEVLNKKYCNVERFIKLVNLARSKVPDIQLLIRNDDDDKYFIHLYTKNHSYYETSTFYLNGALNKVESIIKNEL